MTLLKYVTFILNCWSNFKCNDAIRQLSNNSTRKNVRDWIVFHRILLFRILNFFVDISIGWIFKKITSLQKQIKLCTVTGTSKQNIPSHLRTRTAECSLILISPCFRAIYSLAKGFHLFSRILTGLGLRVGLFPKLLSWVHNLSIYCSLDMTISISTITACWQFLGSFYMANFT